MQSGSPFVLHLIPQFLHVSPDVGIDPQDVSEINLFQDILRQRISGRAPMSPSDNEGGLRYVVARYSNSTVAKVVGVIGEELRTIAAKVGYDLSL